MKKETITRLVVVAMVVAFIASLVVGFTPSVASSPAKTPTDLRMVELTIYDFHLQPSTFDVLPGAAVYLSTTASAFLDWLTGRDAPAPLMVGGEATSKLELQETVVGFSSGYSTYKLHYSGDKAAFDAAIESLTATRVTEEEGEFKNVEIQFLSNESYEVTISDYGVVEQKINLSNVSSYKNITGDKTPCTRGNCSDKYKWNVTYTGKNVSQGYDIIGFFEVKETGKGKFTFTYHSYEVVGHHKEVRYHNVWREVWHTKVKEGVMETPTTKLTPEAKKKMYDKKAADGFVLIRYYGEFRGVHAADGGYKISLDHIPSFEGKEYTTYAWWNASWPKKVPICINNTGYGSALTNYHVQLNVTYDADMQADFDDLRFVNVSAGTEEPYWIEDKLNSNWCLLWFNATSIAASGWSNTTTAMYYGNPSCSNSSNGDNTFEFFDDFEGTMMDITKWDDITVGGSFSDDVTNSILTLECSAFGESADNGEGVQSISTPVTSPVIVQFRYRAQGSVDGQVLRVGSVFSWLTINDVPTVYHRIDNNVYHEDMGGWADHLYTRARDTDWHTTEMWFAGANLKYYEDGSLVGTGDESTSGVTDNKIALCSWRFAQGGELEIDWTFVRKYASPEPPAVVGAEESGPTLAIGNNNAITNDWGQSSNANISITVTNATAAEVNVTYNDTRITNATDWGSKAVGAHWHNQSIAHGGTVGQVYVAVEATTTTTAGVNDTEYFWLNTTKRSNTAAMDSAAAQSAEVSQNFFINATCNEEYSDTFLGAADLLEDGAVVATDSSVTDYVNFTRSEASAGVYNYTARFYNLTHYDNCSTPTYSNVTVEDLSPPGITDWFNNHTNDNATSFTISISDNRTVFFNATANQSITYWVWHVDGEEYQNSSFDNITKTWTGAGNKTVSVYGTNAKGQTSTITWNIEIAYSEAEYIKLIYTQNLLLIEAEKMLAQTWVFLILLLINFALIFFVFKDTHDIFYGDSDVSIATLIISFLAVILSFILAQRALIKPIEMPELNYFLLAIALVMTVLLVRFIAQVVVNAFYAMKAKTY